jgi:hypothetical protein
LLKRFNIAREFYTCHFFCQETFFVWSFCLNRQMVQKNEVWSTGPEGQHEDSSST